MTNILTLYHGSPKIVEKPVFGGGKENNDYGRGFYCTENQDLAKEWAVSALQNGFANRYTIDTTYLKILDLNSPAYNILHWIAVLTGHRVFAVRTPLARRARAYLAENFSINVNAYDIIRGYRADDSYFDYAESFLNNGITVEQLARAMRLGKLGEQIVIKSRYAFACLQYEGCEMAEYGKYYVRRASRNRDADRLYQQMLEEEGDGLYMQDILRGKIKNDDPRIPGNAPFESTDITG